MVKNTNETSKHDPTGEYWSVYILQCVDGTLYTGIAKDVGRRLAMHATGKGAKYMKGRSPFTLIYQEQYPSKRDALKRELKIKAMRRADKLKLAGKVLIG